MLLANLIFLIISLILVFVLNIYKEPIKVSKKRYSKFKIIANIISYLLIAAFLGYFYSFNPLESDAILGVKVNPYVAVVSLILQFINASVLADTWYKIMVERLNNRVIELVLNFLYFMVVVLGNIMLYTGYNGTDSTAIYSSIKMVERFNLIILFIPFVLYDVNLINLIILFVKRRRKVK